MRRSLFLQGEGHRLSGFLPGSICLLVIHSARGCVQQSRSEILLYTRTTSSINQLMSDRGEKNQGGIAFDRPTYYSGFSDNSAFSPLTGHDRPRARTWRKKGKGGGGVP